MVLRALHLCAGYGGFELALRGVARTVAHVERDAYAAATLVGRMEESRLDRAPVWSDLCTFDAEPWRGRVDLVTAGFPCQPFSVAGKRAGTDDDRWLWPDICRIIRDIRPGYVFLENVPGVVRHGLPHVLADLAALGFDAEWGLLSAAAVGAPHKRERFWLVAHATRAGRHERGHGTQPRGLPADTETEGGRLADTARDGLTLVGRRSEYDRDTRHDTHRPGREDVGYAGSAGRSEVARGTPGNEGPHGLQHTHQPHRPGEDVGYAESIRRGPRVGPDTNEREGRVTHPEIAEHQFPPRPDDIDGWQQWQGAQPSVRRGTDGATEWLADALHLGGNGLVPQCARAAWDQLAARLDA